MKNGWNAELQSFVQSYGSDRIDASNLMMPLVFFLSPSDPRLIKTLELAMKKPADGGLRVNNLVFRFTSPINSAVEEGTFTMCSF
jgi:GH15 family glucan-1,4-alpha-glucosidase